MQNKTFIIKFEKITPDDILKTIYKLKRGSSLGIDKITFGLLEKR